MFRCCAGPQRPYHRITGADRGKVDLRMRGRRTRVMGTATAAALLAVMLLAGPSVAAVPGVEVTHDPEISPATPVVGQTVTAVNAAWSPSTDNVRATYLWFRCTSADSFDCAQIAEGQSYVVQAADDGKRLLAAIHV